MLSWLNANSGWITKVWKNRCATGPVHATIRGAVVPAVVAGAAGVVSFAGAGTPRLVDVGWSAWAPARQPAVDTITTHTTAEPNQPRSLTTVQTYGYSKWLPTPRTTTISST